MMKLSFFTAIVAMLGTATHAVKLTEFEDTDVLDLTQTALHGHSDMEALLEDGKISNNGVSVRLVTNENQSQ